MKITYIYQSGFILETNQYIFIFDYYKARGDTYTYLYNTIKNTPKKIYVFVSHSHFDHFNDEIMSWLNLNENLHYILSEEVLESQKVQSDLPNCVFLKKYATFQTDDLFVKAYGSTDVGCSFYIECEGTTIFHAGDLNNWHWNEESDQAYIDEAEAYYRRELKIISDEVKKIDILMFPIDRRLGKDYLKGVLELVSSIKIEVLIPMHFGLNYPNHAQILEKLHQVNQKLKYIAIDKEGYSTKI